jgi:hypothetical protein
MIPLNLSSFLSLVISLSFSLSLPLSNPLSQPFRLKQEQWTDVIKSAGGEKTLNDTTKLRKAIKKREKKKEQSAREWKGRLDTVESESKARIG